MQFLFQTDQGPEDSNPIVPNVVFLIKRELGKIIMYHDDDSWLHTIETKDINDYIYASLLYIYTYPYIIIRQHMVVIILL
jgi:hypothetical protein